jgi:hypothetical protein
MMASLSKDGPRGSHSQISFSVRNFVTVLEVPIHHPHSLLAVIDIHKAWCGPCEVMNPTFRKVFLGLGTFVQDSRTTCGLHAVMF